MLCYCLLSDPLFFLFDWPRRHSPAGCFRSPGRYRTSQSGVRQLAFHRPRRHDPTDPPDQQMKKQSVVLPWGVRVDHRHINVYGVAPLLWVFDGRAGWREGVQERERRRLNHSLIEHLIWSPALDQGFIHHTVTGPFTYTNEQKLTHTHTHLMRIHVNAHTCTRTNTDTHEFKSSSLLPGLAQLL